MPDSAADLTDMLAPLLPRARIMTMDLPNQIREIEPANLWRTRAAEILREVTIANLRPDVIHVSSLFEGFGHDAATSIGAAESDVATAVTLYDLIPLLNPENYLSDGRMRRWYLRKLESLRRADLLLAISKAAATEATSLLDWPEARVRIIGGGVDPSFRSLPNLQRDDAMLGLRYGLTRDVVLYVGGGDPRKNLRALLSAFVQLEASLRARHQLAVVGELTSAEAAILLAHAAEYGLHSDELRLLGYVSDTDLAGLYGLCACFVFPSLHEGFGLPVAEAMVCGAPVIGADASSVPEIIRFPEALFDPRDPADIARVLHLVLTNATFRARLRAHGLAQGQTFSWDAVASRTIDALETCKPGLRPASRQEKPNLVCVVSGYVEAVAILLRDLGRHFSVTLVSEACDQKSDVIDAIVRRESCAWFRSHANTPDHVLYIMHSQSDAQAMALFVACPGTVLLSTDFQPEDSEAISVAALYGEHGLSAAATAAREGVVAAARSYPIIGMLLSLGQGVIVPTREMAETITGLYGTTASVAVEVGEIYDADACVRAIKRFSIDPDFGRYRRTTEALAHLDCKPSPSLQDWSAVATSLSGDFDRGSPRQILIDVTVLANSDVGTGIQRVTRNIATELILSPPQGHKIELVRMTETGFVTARRFATRLLGLGEDLGEDEPIMPGRGDIFLGLDLNISKPAIWAWLEKARQRGTSVLFVVYDLLPVMMPESFGTDVRSLFQTWLAAIIELADGLLCISRSVADDLRCWIDTHGTRRREMLRVGWFHQGTAFHSSAPLAELSFELRRSFDAMRQRRSILAVGTVEPRKGYRQILDTFDVLWGRGIEITLTIVGNRGWLVEDLLKRLDAHPERGRRLFWFSGVSDGILAETYKRSDLLLVASFGEGFGLPIIEARQFGLPVLARDLPVFREVLGNAGTFFDTTDPSELADHLEEWARSELPDRVVPEKDSHSWSDSKSQLVQHLHGDWYLTGIKIDNTFVWTKNSSPTSSRFSS
jgi:glycosyltransferase involved in cell wall biosynthesis